jgi:hypothetical protein
MIDIFLSPGLNRKPPSPHIFELNFHLSIKDNLLQAPEALDVDEWLAYPYQRISTDNNVLKLCLQLCDTCSIFQEPRKLAKGGQKAVFFEVDCVSAEVDAYGFPFQLTRVNELVDFAIFFAGFVADLKESWDLAYCLRGIGGADLEFDNSWPRHAFPPYHEPQLFR